MYWTKQYIWRIVNGSMSSHVLALVFPRKQILTGHGSSIYRDVKAILTCHDVIMLHKSRDHKQFSYRCKS